MKCKIYLTVFVLVSMTSSFQVCANSIAEYKRCIAEKRSEIEKPKKMTAYRDRGCSTRKSEIDGRRHSCNENVCWSAPPSTLIVEAHVWSHSAAGSEHRYGSTQYRPSREFATQICNTVHARSNTGPFGTRGWQKLDANVVVKRQIIESERERIEAECEKKVLGG